MSSNWKLIGRNSGNMSHHRNVASNKLNYETGKWDSIYDVSGKDVKGYTFDICGQNVVLGIGTTKPFSRLSLGTDVSSGIFDPNEMGQLAAIALDEENDGKKFTGILLNSNLTNSETLAQSTPIETTTGIQIMSSVKDFSLNDISNGQIYLTNNNVTTIGGIPRVGNEYNTQQTGKKCPGTYGDRKIVLDVRGSVRTDGYINFYNKISGSTFSPDGTSYDSDDDIPIGSLFLTNGNGSNTGQEGLYFKNKSGVITMVTGTGGGGSSTTDISAAFDVSLNGANNYQYIINKAKSTESTSNSGGVPATFSGQKWAKSAYNSGVPSGFNNAVTIRDGNLAVITPDGDDLKLINAPNGAVNEPAELGQDVSGGIILAQRQLLIGSIKNTGSSSSSNQRYGYGRIDIQGIYKVPSLQCYNYTTAGTDVAYKPEKATNSIILITKNSGDNGSSSGGTIGTTNDCSNTIIIGGRFSSIDTPNSIISNIENINSSTSVITDISGSNIIFGHNNNLTESCYTLIMGASNTIDNTNKSIGTTITGKNQNNILGSSNLLFNSENSFVQGYNNKIYGNQNIVFGNSNSVGNIGSTNTTYKYFTQKSFIQGNNNQITSTYEQPLQNAFIAGKYNKLDMSYNSFTANTNSSYTLLGSYAGISGEVGDTSNVRFAFGTYEKWQANGGTSADNGNVLTIFSDGHVRIDGNLTVDGSFVKLDVIHKDISDNNITLGSTGLSANGGGITILDSIHVDGDHGLTWFSNPYLGSTNYWDTSGADLSTNNLFANNIISQDISANDASFNDLSLNYLYVYNDISATNIWLQGDISGTDASFNDLSLNYLYVHNDISANDGFFQGDLSCNGKLTVGGVIDPTGLIFTVEGTAGQGLGTMGASEGGIFTDGDDLFFIPKGKAYNDASVKKFAQIASGGSSGGMTSFSLAGDTGSETITEGNTVTIATGNGLSSAAAANDKVTISLETKLEAISALTAGDGSFIVGNGSTWVAESGSTARASLGVDPAGTDNSTPVTLASVTSNYLSLDGQEITAGTVPVSLGGTGVATVNKNLVFAGSATTNGQPPSFRALESADIPDHGSGAGKIIIAAATANTTVIEDTTGTAQPILKATAVASGSHYITIENGGTSPYIKSTSGLFIETTDGGDIALGNNANALKLTMPDNGSGAGETFTIEGQEAGGTSHDKGGNVKIIGGTGADTDGGGGDVEIVGGAKRAGGNGDVGNILLQGGYSSTGVTINPAGNISTKGTLTVDSTSTLTGNATFGGNIVANANEAKNIFAAVTSNNITIGGTGSTTVVDGLTVNGDIGVDANEAKNIFTAVTSNNITIGGTGSTTVVDGLTVNGDIGVDANEAKNIFTAVTSNNITIGGSGSTTVVDGLTVNGDISANDISANDISCVDISAVNFFSVGSSFFGDVHAKVASSFHDISGNDASFNDISANSIFSLSNAYFGNIKIETDTDGGSAGNQSVITTTAGNLVLGAATGGKVQFAESIGTTNGSLGIVPVDNEIQLGAEAWFKISRPQVTGAGDNVDGTLTLIMGQEGKGTGGGGKVQIEGGNSGNNQAAGKGDVILLARRTGCGADVSSPEHTLHVGDGNNNSSMGLFLYDNTRDREYYPNTNLSTSIKANHYIWGQGFFHSSDSRIKKNITDVNDAVALQKLRDISCCYYEYIDKITKGAGQTIGFIAQQVKEHLDIAVCPNKEIIPNEMRVLEATWNGLNMSSDLTDVSGVKYKFYVSNDPSGNDEVKKEIVGNQDNTFTFDKHYNNVFCYGKEVDDFHVLDKQKLFTLNFSATQEIDKIQQEEKTKLAAAEAKIAALEARLSALENQ